MSWVKLDDQFFFNRKIIKAGRDARDLYLASLTYCAGQLTDGFIPEEALPLLHTMAGIANDKQIASKLLSTGLWEVSDNGYLVHDYLEYNPTKEQVEITRKARAEAGSRGGRAKGSKTASKTQANGKQNASKSLPRPRPPTPITTTTTTAAAVFDGENGRISPIEHDQIEALCKESETFRLGLPRDSSGADIPGEQWVIEAIREARASSQDKRLTVRYVQAILDRWEKDGYKSKRTQTGRPGTGGDSRGGREAPRRVPDSEKRFGEGWDNPT